MGVVHGVRRFLAHRVSIGELLVVVLVVGTPYLLFGLYWSSTHTDHLRDMSRVDMTVSYLGSIVSWPVLLFADVTMT